MEYTLITNAGKIMQFYVRSVAEMYQVFEGGVIVDAAVLETPVEAIVYNV